MDISVTERAEWMRCHRRWDLTSYNRRSLGRKDTMPTQLSLGSALHIAFSAQVYGLDPREVAQAWLLAREREIEAKAAKFGLVDLRDQPKSTREFALDLIQHYFDYWGWSNPLATQGLSYIATELPLRARIPDTDGYLVGTIDGVAWDLNRQLWLVEHKTYTQRPDRQGMDTNDQMTAYMWLWREVFGFLPAGVLYDGIAKKLPAIPKLVQTGGLSKAWVDTTAAVYRKALRDAGLQEGPYADFLARLEERDAQEQNPFFTRWSVTIPERSLDLFPLYLANQYRDMAEAAFWTPLSEPLSRGMGRMYPNFRWEGCWDCGVKDLCRAIQLGEDVDYVVETFYTQEPGHDTMLSTKIEAGTVEAAGDWRQVVVEHVPTALTVMGYL